MHVLPWFLDETLEMFLFGCIIFNTLCLHKFLVSIIFSTLTDHLTVCLIEKQWNPNVSIVLEWFEFKWHRFEHWSFTLRKHFNKIKVQYWSDQFIHWLSIVKPELSQQILTFNLFIINSLAVSNILFSF